MKKNLKESAGSNFLRLFTGFSAAVPEAGSSQSTAAIQGGSSQPEAPAGRQTPDTGQAAGRLCPHLQQGQPWGIRDSVQGHFT